MRNYPYGNIVARILGVLDQLGPLTLAEIGLELGLERNSISAVVHRMKTPQSRTPKRIYVSHYVYDMEGARRYPRAVYTLGSNPDAKKPKPDKTNVRRRSDAHKRVINTMNSVFNLAVPRREFRI